MLLSISSIPRNQEIGWFIYLSTFFERISGLLGARPESPGVLIDSCASIHSFGMRMHIDVAFFDSKLYCLRTARDLSPSRMLSCARAAFVLERPAASAPWFEEQERIRIGIVDIERCRHIVAKDACARKDTCKNKDAYARKDAVCLPAFAPFVPKSVRLAAGGDI